MSSPRAIRRQFTGESLSSAHRNCRRRRRNTGATFAYSLRHAGALRWLRKRWRDTGAAMTKKFHLGWFMNFTPPAWDTDDASPDGHQWPNGRFYVDMARSM